VTEGDSITVSDSIPSMSDAAEMLWVTLANVSGGDWTQQTPEWQEAAARWRDAYFRATAAQPREPGAQQQAGSGEEA